METSSQKKLGKLDILIKENAPDWFQQMESHLRDEKQWKVIQQVITERERLAAITAARTPKITPLPETPEGTPEPPESSPTLEEYTKNEDWNAKNWKVISLITV